MLGLYASLAYRQWFKYLLWTSTAKSHGKKRIRLCNGTLHLCNKHYDAIVKYTSSLSSHIQVVLYTSIIISCRFSSGLLAIIICGLLISIPNNSTEQSPFWEAINRSAGQEIPRLLWNPNIFYRVQKTHSLVSVLCQINPSHILLGLYYFFKIHFNIILS
jgi:hypothetical protein